MNEGVNFVLVGHSIAGEELSSVATRYLVRIAGLVYLEAGYLYAYQNPASLDFSSEESISPLPTIV